jgi:hypothetical protein
MDTKNDERPDLLLDETVAALREVFQTEHAFPTSQQWIAADEPRPGYLARVGGWFRRVLGFGSRSNEAGEEGRDPTGG